MPTSNAISILFRYPIGAGLRPALSRKVRKRPLREFLIEAAHQIAPNQGVACLITNDNELQDLNRRFLRKDYPTDVLSFPSANGEPGELAISLDRAAAQAAAFGHSIEDELRILMLHGLLHLAGMDHEIDTGEMARAEARWRKRLKLPPGLVERASA
jgi:probable rRNA maturation factor